MLNKSKKTKLVTIQYSKKKVSRTGRVTYGTCQSFIGCSKDMHYGKFTLKPSKESPTKALQKMISKKIKYNVWWI